MASQGNQPLVATASSRPVSGMAEKFCDYPQLPAERDFQTVGISEHCRVRGSPSFHPS